MGDLPNKFQLCDLGTIEVRVTGALNEAACVEIIDVERDTIYIYIYLWFTGDMCIV